MLYTGKADKWKKEFVELEIRLSEDISQLHSLLSALSDDIKELTMATVKRIQQLSDKEVRERGNLEKTLLKELDDARYSFELKCEKIEKSISETDIELRQR